MFVACNDLNQQDQFCAVHGKLRWLCDHERLILSLLTLFWFVLKLSYMKKAVTLLKCHRKHNEGHNE